MANEYDIQILQEQLKNGTLALFIGTDLPREITGLPSRADMARDLARLKGLDESRPLAEVAPYFIKGGKKSGYIRPIQKALREAKSPQPFQRRIAGLAKERSLKTIITTAYDDLLEWALRDAGVEYNRVVRSPNVSSISPNLLTLVKLYGDIQDEETLVVTARDRNDLLRKLDRKPVVDYVRQVFRLNTVLFIGYNLDDPDFQFLFDEIAESDFAQAAYAVWHEPLDAQSKSMRENRGITILDQDPFGILDAVTTMAEVPNLAIEGAETTEETTTSSVSPAPSAAKIEPRDETPPDVAPTQPSATPLTQHKLFPQIDSNLPLSKLEETILQHVHPNCEQALVEAELGGGFSGAQVLLVVPKPKKDGPPKPRKVTKLGAAHEMRRERDKYAQYVDEYLPFCATRVEEDTYYEQEGLAGLNYVFVHDGITFEEHYGKAFAEGDVERVKNVLIDLLDKKLGYRWYQYFDSTPVFFRTEYSRQLVEDLRIKLRPDFPDQLGVLDKLLPSTEKFYTQLDPPVIYQKPETISPGDLVTIKGLVPTRIKRKEVTLEDANGRGIVIGVEFSPEMCAAQGLDFENSVGVRGQVVYDRHGQMTEIVRAVFRGLKPGIGRIKSKSVRLPCGTGDNRSQVYPNPLQMYPDVLKETLEARLSTVHGDLNLRNILVDELGKGWLIDFAKVERRHNVFDFIKLEARLRTSELSREGCEFSLCDYLAFEEALNEAALGRSAHPPTDPHLQFAYKVILTIREIARKYMGPNPDFRKEYFPALLLYCLGMMRYYKNDGKRSAQLAFATACVQGRYNRGEDESKHSAALAPSPIACVDRSTASAKGFVDTRLADHEQREQIRTLESQRRIAMRGIPGVLLQPLRQAFMDCDELYSNKQLLAIFQAEELKLWKSGLSLSSNVGEQADILISYLTDKYRTGGENGLILFLQALISRRELDDELHARLTMLVDQLGWLVQRPSRPEATVLEANPAAAQMLWTADAEKMLVCARAVARVEVPRFCNDERTGTSAGTGWLVAPGLALTCRHVVDTLVELETSIAPSDLQAQLANVLLTFDYTVAGNGLQYRLDLPERSFIQSKTLDYAVLRLVDREDVPLQGLGYLRLDVDAALTVQTSLYIIQHPLGQPQQSTGGAFVRYSSTSDRILYETPTEPGTSGAPVFNRVNWRVAALHNGENEAERLREGTLIRVILKDLKQHRPELYDEIMAAQNAKE